jgi:Methyltransferase domain
VSGHRIPWQARARVVAQRAGIDPRYLRRLRWLHKARAVRRSGARLRAHVAFVLAVPEPDNFTYEIANEAELGAWVAAVAGCPAREAAAYVAEPAADLTLARRRQIATSGRWLWTKRAPAYGKRLGWYALARALRPRLIVETGAHDGLGSLLLLRALERNATESGVVGRLVSFDVNPTAGWLVGGHPQWELLIGSSEQQLPLVLAAGQQVDMFVYDGWHTYAAERADLQLIAPALARDGVLLSDDAQVSRALADTCRERGLSYHAFHERPVGHFHPGAVLGAGRR